MMLGLQSNIALNINPKVYKKDPLSSDLGKQILAGGIDLLSEIGFEDFTFKKLSIEINSTEASIYRYFDNKHNLLTYLTMWYWGWLQYSCAVRTINIESPHRRLVNIVNVITKSDELDVQFDFINEVKLLQIVITESSKVYHCKKVDEDNKEGFFLAYKELVAFAANVVLEIDKEYKYPNMLISTIIEGAHQQRFFAEHLPRLTNTSEKSDMVAQFFLQIIQNELNFTLPENNIDNEKK